MKLSCLQEHLDKGLGIVSSAVSTRTTLPITNTILLATDNGRLKLVATDLEKTITHWIDAKVEEDGAICLPAGLLTEFVGQLNNREINLVIAPKTHIAHLKCDRDTATIAGLDTKDFPLFVVMDQGVTISIEVGDFKQAISQVIFASSTIEEVRPVLTGIDVKIDGSNFMLAAADGFRLAVYKLTLTKPVDQKVEVIIPVGTLKELQKLMGNETEPIQITISSNRSRMLFRLKDTELESTLIQGTFPQYEKLIPQSFSTKAVVDTKSFLMAVKTAVIFAHENQGIVRVVITPGGELTPGKMAISGNSKDIGDSRGEIDAVIQGDEAKIALRGTYLTAGLGVLKEDRVSFETSSPSSALVIRPEGSDNYSYTVIPMFVQW